MRVGLSIGSANYQGSNWEQMVALAQAADRLGVDSLWTAEAWGMDAVTPLAYLAATTERIALGSGIMQISARTPAMAAMTALSLDRISNGRFRLGLGVSGPQVVEGLHGESFEHPLQRLREYISVVRLALTGEPITYSGEHYQLPRPGGDGVPLKLSMAPSKGIPIYLATLGPKMLELTGELGDGWLGTSFIPEASATVMGHLQAGAQKANKSIHDLDINVMVTIDIDDDVERAIQRNRRPVAFYIGAMGSAQQNFYKNAFARAGWSDVVEKIQALWLGGQRSEAIAATPDELVLASQIVGNHDMVKERLRTWQSAGVTTLRIAPIGADLNDQIAHLEAVTSLVHDVTTT
jgi:F420-dependent oxidoreductase-like protein